MRKPLYWILIVAVVAILLYFIVAQWFPQMIKGFTAFLIGICTAVFGVFFRKKRN